MDKWNSLRDEVSGCALEATKAYESAMKGVAFPDQTSQEIADLYQDNPEDWFVNQVVLNVLEFGKSSSDFIASFRKANCPEEQIPRFVRADLVVEDA